MYSNFIFSSLQDRAMVGAARQVILQCIDQVYPD
jgi:hypothetical protein